MKKKDYFVEILEGAENTRTFIVREPVGQGVVRPVLVTTEAEELAQFFSECETQA